jgi:hypothetical protein
LFALFDVACASAQKAVNVGLGAVVPIGSSADLLNSGYNAMLSYSFQPSWMRKNYLRLEGAVNSLAEKTTVLTKRQIISGTVNVVIGGAAQSAPFGYVIIGAGTYQNSGGSVQRRSDPGFNVGTGIRFTMGFFGTFVEARLHFVNDDAKTKYFPMTFGLTF